jgi:ABC-type multidrug transport system fused ATPase/permease subunit
VVIIAHRINIVQPCDCIVMTELGGAVGCDSW